MKSIDCERVRDTLPEYAQGHPVMPGRAAVERHLAACDACAAELNVVQLVARHPVVPGDGLAERIIAAARRPARPRVWRRPALLAAAATVTAALLGVSLLVKEGRLPALQTGVAQAPAVLVEEAVGEGALSWLDNDPLLRSGVGLYDLSVEELEVLLMELDS